MFQLRPGRSSATDVRVAYHKVRLVIVLGLALSLGACANTQGDRQQAGGPTGQAAQIARMPTPEVEDDGLPVQTPPQRAAQEPDDPSEPFSRNYGSPVASPAAAMRRTEAVMPQRVVSSLAVGSDGRARVAARN